MPVRPPRRRIHEQPRDHAIGMAIEERLRELLPQEVEQITIEVLDGTVTLRGDVPRPEDIRRATAACRGVPGVQHIIDFLRPRLIAPTTH